MDMENERLSDMLRSLSVSNDSIVHTAAGTGADQTKLGVAPSPMLNSLPSMRPTDGLIGNSGGMDRNSSRGGLSFVGNDSFLDTLLEDGGSRSTTSKRQSWMSIDPEKERKRKEADDWYQKKINDKKQKERPSWMSIDPEREKKRQEADAWYQKKVSEKKQKEQPSWMSIDPERETKRKEAEDWYQQQV